MKTALNALGRLKAEEKRRSSQKTPRLEPSGVRREVVVEDPPAVEVDLELERELVDLVAFPGASKLGFELVALETDHEGTIRDGTWTRTSSGWSWTAHGYADVVRAITGEGLPPRTERPRWGNK